MLTARRVCDIIEISYKKAKKNMLYFMSDIHAQYGLFCELMEKIKFSANDELIICGDIIEKGPESVRLAKLIFQMPNVKCILGNHEYAFLKKYWYLMKNSPDDFDQVLRELQEYFPEDGHLLDWETVDAFESLPPYIETEEYICVHAGLPLDANNQILPLKDAEIEFLINDRRFKEPNILPKSNQCVFFGHTPASFVSGNQGIICYPRVAQPKSVRDFYKIHLDMGTMTSGIVGCICMDTLEEFYVKRKI